MNEKINILPLLCPFFFRVGLKRQKVKKIIAVAQTFSGETTHDSLAVAV